MKPPRSFLPCWLLVAASLAFGQANGKLQIHFLDVGQGDGAVLISPLGEIVLFDDGVLNNCDRPLSYLQGLGITRLDYLFVSHYHADHIGCTPQILEQFPLQWAAFDRGGEYNSATYRRHVLAVGDLRQTAWTDMTITLDAESEQPVEIQIVAVNADGAETDDENSLSLVALVRFGSFKAVIGGDLVGVTRSGELDVETPLAPRVGPVDVYKVHHHCSRYSTNDAWVGFTIPTVSIVSVGESNPYGHPTLDCLTRLHSVNSRTYWTSYGAGAEPDPVWDVVAGSVLIETVYAETNQTFTLTYSGTVEEYPVRYLP